MLEPQQQGHTFTKKELRSYRSADPVSGPGAWYVWPRQQRRFYRVAMPLMGLVPLSPTRLDLVQNWAVLSIQYALISAGFNEWEGLTPMGVFGKRTLRAVRRFQYAKVLTADGVVGPSTAQALFELFVTAQQDLHAIPDNWLCGLTGHESGWDPGAIGYADNRDRGLEQINSASHPDVADWEAFNAAFSISWAAQRLTGYHDHFVSEDCDEPWKLAVYAHNSPAGAEAICSSGAWSDAGTSYVQYVANWAARC